MNHTTHQIGQLQSEMRIQSLVIAVAELSHVVDSNGHMYGNWRLRATHES